MVVFDSFDGLKNFMDSISDFLRSDHYLKPFPPPTPWPLGNTERAIITNIYNSYRRGKGKIIKQISGNFLHLLQILVPSQNFADIFRHLIYLEWMEHRIKPDPSKFKKNKLYRDHILHCANVCWIGHRLIFDLDEPFYDQLKICLGKILPSNYKKFLKDEEDWRVFIKTTWYITAMIHDFGYPIELVKKKYTGEELYLCSKHYLHTNELTNYFDNHLAGSIPLFKEQLKKIDGRILDNPFQHCKTIHPIIGSLELLHFLKNNYRKLSGRRILYRPIYQLAALGILEHHKEVKIDFDLNPFGYILVLADTIHEWHRYICTGTTGAGSTKLSFLSPITKVTIKKEASYCYNIKFKMNPHKSKCKEWNSDIFKKGKIKELERLKRKTGLPQFEVRC